MKKYFVVATVWSDDAKALVKRIVGEFDKFYLAMLFRDAYNENYNASATIQSSDGLIK